MHIMLSIVFTILGIAAVVVFAIQVYKTAVSTERNAALWTLATVLVGIGFQFFAPFAIGVAIGIYYVATGSPLENMAGLAGLLMVADVILLVLSIVGMAMITKVVARVKDDELVTYAPPPPPPAFGENI